MQEAVRRNCRSSPASSAVSSSYLIVSKDYLPPTITSCAIITADEVVNGLPTGQPEDMRRGSRKLRRTSRATVRLRFALSSRGGSAILWRGILFRNRLASLLPMSIWQIRPEIALSQFGLVCQSKEFMSRTTPPTSRSSRKYITANSGEHLILYLRSFLEQATDSPTNLRIWATW